MRLVRTVAELRSLLAGPRANGRSIGLVPTMGSFHAGHLALMAASREADDVVVVSLFVNPAQFGPSEDLEHYPRDEAADAAAAEAAGVDILFVPTVDEMYPPGFDTWVDPGELATVLEGAVRPNHFRGVATVCTRLFGMAQPTRAYFGRKDAQQVAVVKQVVRDLALPLEIVACPTVRDADGLALSSRNVYLSPDQRAAALALPRALRAALEAPRDGGDPIVTAKKVLDAEPRLGVDYVALADFDGPTLVGAVRVGSTRLIDNVVTEEP